MNEIWDYTVLNNSIKSLVVAITIVASGLIGLRVFAAIAIKRVQIYTAGTASTFDDFIVKAIKQSFLPAMYVTVFYAGCKYLTLSSKFEQVLHIALLVVLTFFCIRIISSLVKYILRRASAASNQGERQSNGILLIIQILLWVAGILFVVDNLGYDITAIVAGLGIGGIAIALAAQTILGDLFSYLVIFFDKPFEVGDFIIIDSKMGTVEHIGIKTTRLRTLGGEQLICSNTDLTNSRVHNYKRMQERRVVFSFKVVYGTSADKIKRIPRMVKVIVESQPDTRFDRAHFQSFGEFSFNFEVVYYVLSPEYNVYMDTQQAINIMLLEAFKQQQVEFAIPAQNLFMSSGYRPYASTKELQ